MQPYNHPSSRPAYACAYPQPGRQVQQLPRLNTNLNASEESLHLPIQHPSPIKPQHSTQVLSQIKRKPVPEVGRPDSGVFGHFDPYQARLQSSREALLQQKLVPAVFHPNASASNAAQEKIYSINMRVEPDRSIFPVSPYQAPANMPWLQQSLQDPHARLRDVRSEMKLKRGGKVARNQPKQKLQARMKKDASEEYAVLANIRMERHQLGRAKQALNSNQDDYAYPLLGGEQEDSVADLFGREYEARQNGERRRLPAQKLRKPQYLVEGRSRFVEKASRYEKQGMVQEDFSGWFGESRKRDRAWKKVKIAIVKVLRPKQNKWQRL